MAFWPFGKGKPVVKVSHTRRGVHGENWRVVGGSEHSALAQARPVGEPTPGITRVQHRHDRLVYDGLRVGGTLLTSYPWLLATRTVPMAINEIVEWDHVDRLSAHIIGTGGEALTLNFFATDYAEQAATYRAGGTLPIALSALADKLAPEPPLPDDGAAEDDGCCTPYSADPARLRHCFVGQLLSVEDLVVGEEHLCLCDIRLLSHATAPATWFDLEMLVNRRHVTAPLLPGCRVSGYCWLTGRLG